MLVPDAEKLPKVSISDGDALEEFLADSCPDSLVPVLMAAQALYTSWKLQGMLSYAPGKSLSHNQVAQHDVYGKQLRMLKDLALKYVAKQDANGNVDEDGFKDYVRFFGGPKREDGYRYDKVQVKKQDSPKNNMGYTAYNLNVLGYEEFAKRVELLFKDTDAHLLHCVRKELCNSRIIKVKLTIIFSITRQAAECAIIDFLEDSSDEVFHSTKDTSPLRFGAIAEVLLLITHELFKQPQESRDDFHL